MKKKTGKQNVKRIGHCVNLRVGTKTIAVACKLSDGRWYPGLMGARHGGPSFPSARAVFTAALKRMK